MILFEGGRILTWVNPSEIPPDGHFILPEGLTSIGAYAFRGCTGLTQVTFPKGLTKIGAGAFRGCTGLTQVTFPEGLTSIGAYAFRGCTGLTQVTFPEGLAVIPPAAFMDCPALRFISIDTQDRAEFARIQALLPQDLYGGVMTKADYEATIVSRAERLRQAALERLCGLPHMHPLREACSFFPTDKDDPISRLNTPGIISELNEWVGSSNSVYARVKNEIEAVLLPRNTEEFPAYQAQLEAILTRCVAPRAEAETEAAVADESDDEARFNAVAPTLV